MFDFLYVLVFFLFSSMKAVVSINICICVYIISFSFVLFLCPLSYGISCVWILGLITLSLAIASSVCS